MKRRELLKALASLPLAALTQGCRHGKALPAGPALSGAYHTLQIGIEGAFSLVIHKDQHNQVTAFVPRPTPEEKRRFNLVGDHRFYFNEMELGTYSSGKSFSFNLMPGGLNSTEKIYVNPGFHDFEEEAQVWKQGDDLVRITLPAPDSISFSGRPQPVLFRPPDDAPKERPRRGLMPTNYILEYYLTGDKELRLECHQLEDRCPPLPHCPPGIARYFFAVAPEGQPKFMGKPFDDTHAVNFFNFMLETRFPELAKGPKDHRLLHIGPQYGVAPATQSPAVLRYSSEMPRFQRASATIDCQSGGIIITRP